MGINEFSCYLIELQRLFTNCRKNCLDYAEHKTIARLADLIGYETFSLLIYSMV